MTNVNITTKLLRSWFYMIIWQIYCEKPSPKGQKRRNAKRYSNVPAIKNPNTIKGPWNVQFFYSPLFFEECWTHSVIRNVTDLLFYYLQFITNHIQKCFKVCLKALLYFPFQKYELSPLDELNLCWQANIVMLRNGLDIIKLNAYNSLSKYINYDFLRRWCNQ